MLFTMMLTYKMLLPVFFICCSMLRSFIIFVFCLTLLCLYFFFFYNCFAVCCLSNLNRCLLLLLVSSLQFICLVSSLLFCFFLFLCFFLGEGGGSNFSIPITFAFWIFNTLLYVITVFFCHYLQTGLPQDKQVAQQNFVHVFVSVAT